MRSRLFPLLALVAGLGLLAAAPGCATTRGGGGSVHASPEEQFLARMAGDWRLALDGEARAQFDAAKAQADANPDDEMAQAMVALMQAMMDSLRLNVTGDQMTLHMGDEAESVSWRVISTTADGGVIESVDNDGVVERVTVVFGKDDLMTWTMDDKPEPLSWARVR